jgi:hypothetical protein
LRVVVAVPDIHKQTVLILIALLRGCEAESWLTLSKKLHEGLNDLLLIRLLSILKYFWSEIFVVFLVLLIIRIRWVFLADSGEHLAEATVAITATATTARCVLC